MTAHRIHQHLARLRAEHLQGPAGEFLPRLLAAWSTCVPAPLRDKGRPTFCNGREALIDVDSSVWLARLRQEQVTLCGLLRAAPGLHTLESVRGRVRAATLTGPGSSARPPAPLPDAARAAFARLALETAEPALKAALERLATATPGGNSHKNRR